MATRFPYSSAPTPVGASFKPWYVMLATPVGVAPCTKYAVSLAGTAETLSRADVRFEIETLTGGCHVDDARNVIIRNFLQSTCTDLFFLDADLGWQPNNILRLLKLPGDIVCGVYRHKDDVETYPFHPFEGEHETDDNGLFAMPKAATGFMRIRRPVVEALYEREKAKERLMWLDGDNKALNRLPVARICERGFVRELGLEHLSRNHASQSGDYVLCLKARSLGFSVFVAPDMEFWHTGEKTWHGQFGNYLRREKGQDRPKFEAAMESIASGFTTPQAFEMLVDNNLYGSPGFALPPAALEECWAMARQAHGDILECGSGLSTLVMGLALKGSARRLYSLENNLEWVDRVQTWLERYGVENVRLIYAPLQPGPHGVWYGAEASDLPDRFDGLLVDGPKRDDGVNRLAVFDVLGDAIRGARTWIVDDVEDLTPEARGFAGRTVSMIEATAAGMKHQTAIATLPQAMSEAAE